MKALIQKGYGDTEKKLELGNIEKPFPKSNQVLIKVIAASVNPVDYKIVKGNLKFAFKQKFPCTTGLDVSGIVEETGGYVRKYRKGDEVHARLGLEQKGAVAEYAVVNEKHLAYKPKNINHKQSACIPLVSQTAWQCLNDYAKLKKGQKILIFAGSGGVGSVAIQIAKAMGAEVTATTSTQNVEWVKELGADTVIDYKKTKYKDIEEKYDVILDTLGGKYTITATQKLKEGGKIVSIAGPKDLETIKEFTQNRLIWLIFWLKNRKINKLTQKIGAKYFYVLQKPNGKQQEEINKLVEAGKLKIVIEKVFPFEKSIDAYKHVEKGRTKGKVVIEIVKEEL